MATIGLDKLYYAKITEDENGNETYATPVQLAKAMNADLSVELAEATLYADDGAAEIVKEFKNGTLSLGVDDVGASVASDLTGATIDANGVVVSTSEDGGDPVAVGCTVSSSVSPPRTLLPRATASPSALLPSRAPFSAAIRWMVMVSIPGRQRSPRVIPL